MPKLLIVDDETDVREFARNFFERKKVDVMVAASGEEALTILNDERPNLVLLDMRLGGMDGIEVLRKIRQMDNDIEVIILTGIVEEETVEMARELGVVDCIQKPLILDELEKIVLSRFLKK